MKLSSLAFFTGNSKLVQLLLQLSWLSWAPLTVLINKNQVGGIDQMFEDLLVDPNIAITQPPVSFKKQIYKWFALYCRTRTVSILSIPFLGGSSNFDIQSFLLLLLDSTFLPRLFWCAQALAIFPASTSPHHTDAVLLNSGSTSSPRFRDSIK